MITMNTTSSMHKMNKLKPKAIKVLLIVISHFLLLSSVQGATPGMPFEEDFADSTLQDLSKTNAQWNTDEEKLLIASWKRRFGAFGPTSSVQGLGGSNVTDIAVGDVNGDGYLDWVAGRNGANIDGVNRLYLGSGNSSTLVLPGIIYISTDSQLTSSVALGDVNEDGHLDVVVGNDGQLNTLYLNNGTSDDPFAGVLGISINSPSLYTRDIALIDVNNDGRLDLMAGNFSQTNALHLNNGTANPFSDPGTLITTGTNSTMAIALADVNDDGYADLVTGNLGQNRLYLNNAGANADPFSGVIGTSVTSDSQNTYGIALADVDGNGSIDIVAGNDLAHNKLYLNNGVGVFATASNITDDQFPTSDLVLNDVDNDGDLDLIAATNYSGVGDIKDKLYLNNGTNNPFSTVGSGINISESESQTTSLAMGDFNSDGQPDLISGSETNFYIVYNANSESPIHVNSENALPGSILFAKTIISGDVNKDGHIDLVVGGDGKNTLHLNNGSDDPYSGVSPITLTSSIGPLFGITDTRDMALADFDLDGGLDLVTANFGQLNSYNPNSGGALAANGGNFTTQSNDTLSLAVGDLDGDGYPDIVTANFSNQSNKLYTNISTGPGNASFSASDIDSLGCNSRAVALGDVDGDGDLDILIGNDEATSVCRNRLIVNHSGNFSTGSYLTSQNTQTQDIAVGDLNSDGKLDLIIVGPNTTFVYLNDGSSSPYLGTAHAILSTNSANSVSVEDINGDSHLDLIVSVVGSNKVIINNGSNAPFTGVLAIEMNDDGVTQSLTAADLDNDGDVDIATAEFNQGGQFYLNDGSPIPFLPVLAPSSISNPTTNAVAYGDIDGDGDLDLVTGHGFTGTGSNYIHTNNGDATFTKTTLTTGTAFVTRAIELVDIDSDGDLDIVTGNDAPDGSAFNLVGAQNHIYFNLGGNPATFSTASNITLDSHKTQAIALGDVNRDGHIDFISGNARSTGEDRYLYLNNGTSDPFSGVSGIGIQPTRLEATQAMALGDIDNDGDLDLITGSNNAPVQLHLNDGDNTPFSDSTELQITGSNHSIFSMDLGDVDNDGNLDLILGSRSETNKLYLNSGTGVNPFAGVAAKDISADDDLTEAITMGDIDNDGDLDVIAGNFNAPNKFYLNSGGVNPFANTGSGTAFPGGNSNTRAFALADLDSDGDLDVVSGEAINNRLFLNGPIRYNLNFNKARSVRVDTEATNIDGAILNQTLAQPLPANTSVDYYLSNNGGVRWFKTEPAQALVFPTSGTDLRWRAELASGSPVLSPQIETIEIIKPNLQLTISEAQISESGFSGLTITRNSSSNFPLEVTLASNDPTEVSVPASVTIPAGQSSVYFNIYAPLDNLVDGVVSVQITATAAGYNNASDSIVVTDSDVPELTLVMSPDTAVEGYPSGTVTGVVTRNTGTLSPLTVNLSSNDTSEITVPASVIIAAGQVSSDPFTVEVVDDAFFDLTQNVTVTASASGFTNGLDTIDVQDNDRNLTLNFLAPSILENSGAMATTATVTRNTETNMPLTVFLGSFDESEATVPASIIIAAGQSTSPAFPVNAVDDAIADGTQTVIISADATDHNGGRKTIDVLDNEVAALTMTISYASISEGDDVRPVGGVVVRNSDLSGPLTVAFTTSDSSEAVVPNSVTFTAGFYEVGFPLEAIDDSIADGTQTVTITASAVGHNNGSDTVDILDDDGFLELNIVDSSISENGGTGATTATVTRVGGTHTSALEVALSSNKRLEATVQTSITIAAGQSTSAAFPINAIDEELVDGTQTVTILATAPGFVSDTENLDVTDDDVPTLSVVITPDEIFEFGGEGIVRVTRNTDTSADLIVNLTSDDTAQATVVASITIPAGETNHFGRAHSVRDFIPDGTQTVTITASAAGFISASDTLDILDEDALLRVDFLAPSIAENSGLAATTATVTRVGGVHTLPLEVTLSSNDTTEATVQTSITIAAGQSTSPSFPINAVDDALIDGDQTVNILATATAHVSGIGALDVTDDEVGILTIYSFGSLSETLAGNNYSMSITRDSNISHLEVTLTSSDTSELTVSPTVIFRPGQTTAFYSMSIVDDAIADGTQTVTVTASAAGHTDGTFDADILDDDDDDLDGVVNDVDNCPADANANQLNSDDDTLGNECDDDDDNDLILDNFPDNCPLVANFDQRDGNNNGIGDVCEPGFCFPVKAVSGSITVICL